MRKLYATSVLLFLSAGLQAQLTEIEPNGSYDQANNWTYGQTMSGSECIPPSFDADHFRIVLPVDGVIHFTVTTQGSGTQPGTLEFALFPKYGFYQQYYTLAGDLAPTTVSFSHSCLSGDTMYVRLQQGNGGDGSCVSYEMAFDVTPQVFANDPGPNEDFANPQPVALGTPIEGHLNFLYDNTQDNYGITLPADGTLRLITEAEQADTSTTGTMEVYVNTNNSFHNVPVGPSGIAAVDTFYIPCIAAQLVTVRLQASPCGISYRLRSDFTPRVFANDPLPNDDFANPQPVALGTPIEGHLDFFGETTADHYGLTLPDDGTLRIIAEAEQYDTVSNSTIEVYVNTLNSYCYPVIGGSSVAVVDTFLFDCLPAGNTTIRVQPGTGESCGISYRFRFDLVLPEYGNDTEPNDWFDTGLFVPANTDQDGHLGFINSGGEDFFRLAKPFAGTMRVHLESLFDGPDPALHCEVYNNANGLLVNTNLTTGEDGVVAYDTVDVYTASADTLKLRLNISLGDCGSYRFHYEDSPVGIDAQALPNELVAVGPNPSSDGLFHLTATAFVPVMFEVLDVDGRRVRSGRMTGGELILDLSDLPAGICSVKLTNAAGQIVSTRLVRSR